MFKEKIIIEMKEVFKEIPFGIEHTLKVLKNAEDIMKGENIGEEEKEFISIIAILHDIGAVEAQKKYGSIDGVYQEKEGPEVAKEILKKVGYNKNIDRICFIVDQHIIIWHFRRIKLCRNNAGIFHPRTPGILVITVIEKIITVITRLKMGYFNFPDSANYGIK